MKSRNPSKERSRSKGRKAESLERQKANQKYWEADLSLKERSRSTEGKRRSVKKTEARRTIEKRKSVT